ncbi:MAG: transglutaminase family protein, partial [Ilumatobacteraceae bacterium]
KVVGHGLPIARSPGEEKRWRSTSWFLRDKHCYLVPGDSALGYRLPLESQPWAAPTDMPWIHPTDQTQAFPELAVHRQQEQGQGSRLAETTIVATGVQTTDSAHVEDVARDHAAEVEAEAEAESS